MLNESLFSLPFDALKNILIHNLSIFDVSVTYVLVYVVYKVIGRYIYFKPQEHSSKINRTFLVISLLIISLNFLYGVTSHLPFLPEYRWLYAVSALTLLVAPLSILMDRLVWKYDGNGYKEQRNYSYIPIAHDYYKTNISKSERDGNTYNSWEEEGVESTRKNLHSDALLNIYALIVFIVIEAKWAHESFSSYGYYSFIFFVIISLWITAIFLDRSVFSWIKLAEEKYYIRKNKQNS